MSDIGFFAPAIYGVGCSLALIASVILIRRRKGKTASRRSSIDAESSTEVFLLADGKLVETNGNGRKALDSIESAHDLDDDGRLRQFLGLRFDKADWLVAPNGAGKGVTDVSRDGRFQAVRSTADQNAKIVVRSRSASSPSPDDVHSLEALSKELEMLKLSTQVAPFLLWRQTRSGDVIWANQRYIEFAKNALGSERLTSWPIPKIFPSLDAEKHRGENVIRRISTSQTNDSSNWFDCHLTEIGDEILCTAFPADEAVQSESMRHEFIQTLTTTFSDLAIGLAVFDKSRQLTLFNPALTDLTELPVELLAARPTLMSFLDQLRDRRVMPEPRDYRSWRESIAELEVAATNGTYSDTWSLPNGQTYRVSGQPHPGGGFALLFEDISAEMSLTRKFRAQIEQSYAVIDALDDAVAIFSASGDLSFANEGYRSLFNSNHGDSGLGLTVVDAIREWRDQTVPSPIWSDVRDFIFQNGERADWAADVALLDGRGLTCRFVPQRGGSTLTVFRINTAAEPSSEELRQVS